MQTHPIHHIVIMGVSGCGKTTVAGIVADRMGLESAEADNFHSQANVEKMAAGHALNDEDRWPWLEDIREWMNKEEQRGQSSILTCSALKRSYRDVLRGKSDNVIFVHLDGDKDLILRRMSARIGHFMPTKLLDSQLATLEALEADEKGFVVDVDDTPQNIASEVITKCEKLIADDNSASAQEQKKPSGSTQPSTSQASSSEKADIGVYGLGVMGTSLARNFARNGFKVAVYNYETDVTRDFMDRYGTEGAFIPTFSEDEFAGELSTPRVALLMVTAGKVTEQVTRQLADVFESGDIIVDMGNSHFPDTRAREQALRPRNLHFVGCGTSGGQEGALRGPSLMVGGSDHAFERLKPMFTKISAKAADGTPCCAHTGTDGAGHFVKMIHNGIEYADMQLISEAYSLLRYGAGLSAPEIAKVFFTWNEGELNSYLMQCSAQILAHKDADTGKPFIDIIDDRAGQKGTGLWTVKEALDLGIALTGIAEATLVRMLSGQSTERAIASSAFGSLQTENVIPIEPADRPAFIDAVGDALYASKIIAYSQGFDALQAGAKKYGWKMDLAEVAKVWRAGCIIRAQFLDRIAAAYADEGLELLMAAEHFADRIRDAQKGWRTIIVEAVQRGIAIPAFASSLAYFDAIRKERMATALVQSQRDFFGAHTYGRVDKEGVYHTLWADDMSEIRVDK